MNGAREYATLFETGQYGRLYITSSSHARGKTFHIQILPEGEAAQPNGPNNICLNKDAVEVYGVISGNPGWTETYGWLHEGPWQTDFQTLVEERRESIAEAEAARMEAAQAKDKAEELRQAQLLASY